MKAGRIIIPGILSIFAFASCGDESSAPIAPAPAPSASTKPSDDDAGAPPPKETDACATNDVALELTFDSADGLVDRQLVPVKTQKGEGWLAIDTGSALTFLYGTDGSPNQKITIGCEPPFDVIVRDFTDEPHNGKPIYGVLGADFFNTPAVPAELDYPKHRVVRHPRGDQPAETDGYLEVPLVDAGGHIGVRAVVDGTSRLLMVDTGSPHVLLVPVEGRPTDEKTQVQDASGAIIDAWVGDSDIVLGLTEARRAPAYRIPKWPYFEGYQKTLHPELAGLFGRSSLGFRRVIVDAKGAKLKLGPIQPSR